VVSATTCDPGLASRDDHTLLLPRFVDTSRVSEAEFVGWLGGVPARVSRRSAHAAKVAPGPVMHPRRPA